MKIPEPLQQVDRTYVLSEGKKLSYFAGCDYYRLASHPQVLAAAKRGVDKFGLNVSASRITTGNHALYPKLEHALEDFFDCESATLASNGYSPNLMVAQALRGEFSHVLIDERAHGCLADAAGLMDCPVIRFKNLDAADLETKLKRLGSIKALVMTDGMFSHDGSIPPLHDYFKLLPSGSRILVDDAHAAAILGQLGRGSLEYHKLPRKHVIQTITLSKAFGVYGGAVLADKKLRQAILDKSRLFSGNTPLPLPLANAALTSISLLKKSDGHQQALRKNIQLVRKALDLPLNTEAELQVPLIAIHPKSKSQANRLMQQLAANRIHAPFIHYPGGPKDGYFRFAISSQHSEKQLRSLVDALR